MKRLHIYPMAVLPTEGNRAALLMGKNPRRVGMGFFFESGILALYTNPEIIAVDGGGNFLGPAFRIPLPFVIMENCPKDAVYGGAFSGGLTPYISYFEVTNEDDGILKGRRSE